MYTSFSGDTFEGGLYFYVNHDGQVYHAPGIAASAVWNAAWHMVAGTFDGSTARFFLDGVQIGNGTPVPGAISYTQPNSGFTIGGYGLFLNQSCAPIITTFKGEIDEVRVYNGAIDAPGIQGINDFPSAGPPPPLAPALPVVHTTSVDQITPGAARVNGTIDDHGTPVPYQVEYGPTTAYGQTSAAQVTTSTGMVGPMGLPAPMVVSLTLSGLASDSDYHARIISGSVRGEDVIFHTSLAGGLTASGYRLVTSVRRAVVAVDNNRVGKIYCSQPFGKDAGRAFAVGGGVRGDQSYAVGGTFPVIDKLGRPTGWAGTLTELPRFQIYTLGHADRPTTDRALAWPWNHSHRLALPAGLLRQRTYRDYSTISMYVVCAHLERTASAPSSLAAGYRLVATVRHGAVTATYGVARISCAQPFGKAVGRVFALGGGVRGDQSYAVGETFPVFDPDGQPTGWAGALTEMPRFKTLLGERMTTDAALTRTFWTHIHHFTMPTGLLQLRNDRDYSKVSMYVVCAHLESTTATRPVLLAATPGYRLVASVRHGVVSSKDGAARISCRQALASPSVARSPSPEALCVAVNTTLWAPPPRCSTPSAARQRGRAH
jgi:hypothetical protein